MSHLSRFYIIVLVLLFGSAALVGLAQDDSQTLCPVGQGFWKNNPAEWPVDSLVIGAQAYTQDELIAILNLPTQGDASLILAHQLIAAKLNIESGVDSAAIQALVAEADGLLSQFAGELPFNVPPSTSEGSEFVLLAGSFDAFNQGLLHDDCADEVPLPEVTEEPVMPIDFDNPVIVIEGPVTAININIVTIYNINIIVAEDDPILTVIQIGDIIRVEGELGDTDDLILIDGDVNVTIVLIAINITIINVDVVIIDDGEVWRDVGSCGNPPPPWAPAHGWRRRCDPNYDPDDFPGRGRGRGN